MASAVDLIVRLNSRGAVTSIRELGDQSEVTSRKIRDSNAGTSRSFDEVGKSSKRLKSSIMNLAGLVGFTGLAFGMKDVVTGGMQLQASQAQLQAALKTTGQSASDTYANLTKAAEALSTRGGFSNIQNLTALAAFTRETHSASQATSMLSLATNVARGRGLDLATAQMIVQRAAGGSIGKLQALLGPMVAVKDAAYHLSVAHKEEVFQLDEESKAMGAQGPLWLKQQEILRGITPQVAALATLQDKHATATMVMAAAQKEFAGSTAAYGKTTAGQMSNMRNAVKNLTDSIGQSLLPIVNKLIGIMSGLFSWLGKNKVVLYGLFGAIGAVSAVLATHAALMEVVKAKDIVLAGANKLLGLSFGEAAAGEDAATVSTGFLAAAMDALPIIAIAAGVILLGTLFVTQFGTIKRVALDAFKWIGNAISDVWKWIKGNWPLLLGILTGPIGLAIAFTVTHFKMVKTAVGDVLKFIEGIASQLLNWITWPFRKAWDFIRGIPSKIAHAFSSIPSMLGHAAGGLLSTITGGIFQMGGIVPGPPGVAQPILAHAGEGILTQRATQMIGGAAGVAAINRGQMPAGGSEGGGAFTVTVNQPWVIRLDSRTLTQGVLQYSLRKAARGPSTLSGGQIVTGMAGAIDTVS